MRKVGWYRVVNYREWECDYWDGVNWRGAIDARMHGHEPKVVGDRISMPDEENDGETVTMPRALYDLLYAQKKDVIDRSWSHGSLSAAPKPGEL